MALEVSTCVPFFSAHAEFLILIKSRRAGPGRAYADVAVCTVFTCTHARTHTYELRFQGQGNPHYTGSSSGCVREIKKPELRILEKMPSSDGGTYKQVEGRGTCILRCRRAAV